MQEMHYQLLKQQLMTNRNDSNWLLHKNLAVKILTKRKNAKSSDVGDTILEAEVLSLKPQFAEQLKKQDVEWQRVLRYLEDRAAGLLNQQKTNAGERH